MNNRNRPYSFAPCNTAPNGNLYSKIKAEYVGRLADKTTYRGTDQFASRCMPYHY